MVDQGEPAALASASAPAASSSGGMKRGASLPTKRVDSTGRAATPGQSSSFRAHSKAGVPQELRRRHTHVGHHHHRHKMENAESFGPNVGFLHRLRTSFRLELEERRKGPSLARLASGWEDSPAPLPEGIIKLPELPAFDPESSEAKELCVPGTGWRHRLLLISASCVGFGGYFARTILSAVSADLIVDFGMTRETYGALSGLPAIPNIVFGPLGGVVVDWMGADKSALLYSIIVVLGSGLSSIAVPLKSTKLLGLSQILLGVGKGTLCTAQKVFLKLATDHDEVSFYFALAFSISHLGTFLAFFISPVIAKSPAGYQTCIWFSSGVALLCLFCVFPMLGKLRHIQPLLNVMDESEADDDADSVVDELEEGIPMTEPPAMSATESSATVATAAAEAARESPALETIHSGEPVPVPAPGGDQPQGQEEEANVAGPGEAATGAAAAAAAPAGCLASVRRGLARAWAGFLLVFGDLLTWPFFLFLVACLTFYLAFAPTESWGVYYLKKERHYNSGQASLGTSMIPACSVFLGPAFGALVDKELWKKGTPGPNFRRFYPPGSTQLLSMLMTAGGLLVITLAPAQWPVGFALVSLAYSMACSSLWILVPEFVPVPSLGLAFSIVHAINDVIIMVFEVRIGHALDHGKMFQDTILPIMVFFALLATLTTLLLMRPLRRRAEWNAAVAEAGHNGAGGSLGVNGIKATTGREDNGLVLGSMGHSMGDLYD